MEETDGERLSCERKLTTVDPQERSTWRSGVRSAIRVASQLPGRGLLMWMMPLHLHVNQKSFIIMMMIVCLQESQFKMKQVNE